MDNQHEKITGYRDLSQEEIDLMNEVKEVAEQVAFVIDRLACIDSVDARWVAIAKTDLQKGFMSAVRSIAQPTTF